MSQNLSGKQFMMHGVWHIAVADTCFGQGGEAVLNAGEEVACLPVTSEHVCPQRTRTCLHAQITSLFCFFLFFVVWGYMNELWPRGICN